MIGRVVDCLVYLAVAPIVASGEALIAFLESLYMGYHLAIAALDGGNEADVDGDDA